MLESDAEDGHVTHEAAWPESDERTTAEVVEEDVAETVVTGDGVMAMAGRTNWHVLHIWGMLLLLLFCFIDNDDDDVVVVVLVEVEGFSCGIGRSFVAHILINLRLCRNGERTDEQHIIT